MSIVLHHSRAIGTDKLVLLGIANHEGDGGAWPSLATLARYTNVNRRTVQRAIQQLEAMGELWIGDQQGGTHDADPRYRTNLYRITVRCPADCDGTTQHRVGDRGDSGATSVSPLTDPGVTSGASRGDIQRASGVTPMSPEPSLEPSVEHSLARPLVERACFDGFWKLYPRKVGRRTASTAYERAARRAPPEDIYAGLAARAAWWAKTRTPVDKIPHPTTWLNRDGWADELEPVVTAKAATMAQAQADHDAEVIDEFERAIIAGHEGLAWAIFRGKAAARGEHWFGEIADMLEQGWDPALIVTVTRMSNDTVDSVVAAKAEIDGRCSVARGEPVASPPMLEPGL